MNESNDNDRFPPNLYPTSDSQSYSEEHPKINIQIKVNKTDIVALAKAPIRVVGIPAIHAFRVGFFEALIDWINGYGFSRYEIIRAESYLEQGTLFLTPDDYIVYMEAKRNADAASS